MRSSPEQKLRSERKTFVRPEAERWLHQRAKALLGEDYARFRYELGEPGRRPTRALLRELRRAEDLLVLEGLAEELRALAGLPSQRAGFVCTFWLRGHVCFTRIASRGDK